jgi:hypothetical protein
MKVRTVWFDFQVGHATRRAIGELEQEGDQL